MHILLIEDELGLCRLLRRALEASRHVVDVAAEGEVGLAAALGGDYDLLILDLGLPDLDGLELCRRLRAAGSGTPVLMLTARDEVEDRVAGLDAGAEDYLGKPFALAELLARVRACARRPPLLHPLTRGWWSSARRAQCLRGGHSAAPAGAGRAAPSRSARTEQFAGVQRHLVLSYAAIFSVTLLLLGPALYLSFSSQMDSAFDKALRLAAQRQAALALIPTGFRLGLSNKPFNTSPSLDPLEHRDTFYLLLGPAGRLPENPGHAGIPGIPDESAARLAAHL